MMAEIMRAHSQNFARFAHSKAAAEKVCWVEKVCWAERVCWVEKVCWVERVGWAERVCSSQA